MPPTLTSKPDDRTSAKVVDASQATTCPDKVITKVVVDPGHEDQFVMDVAQARDQAIRAEPNTRHIKPEDKARVADMLKLARAVPGGAPPASVPPPAVGRAVPTVDGANHGHPAAQLPLNVVAPPQKRVHFDIPGYAAMSHRYHAVKRAPGFLILVTDTRYAPSDFYPYASRLANDSDKPIGAYVDGGKRLYLLKPRSVVFRHDPFEFCLVPVAEEKALPEDQGAYEVEDLVGEYQELTQATEGPTHGEAGSDPARADAPRGRAADPDAPIVDNLDFRAGGKGGVL